MDASLHDASLHDLLVDAVSFAVGFALRARHILRARYEGKVSEADTCAVVAHGWAESCVGTVRWCDCEGGEGDSS